MNKAIFLHSLFRAGSTYLFKKFRDNESTWPFYEPLHHDLDRLRKKKLDIWKYNDESISKLMSHPTLSSPHFNEFMYAFKDNGQLPFYNQRYAYHDFIDPPESLKEYIDNLVLSAPESTSPVLQFNRTSLRLKWFKKTYPDMMHVFLLRDPFDQFESYVRRGGLGNNIFLALNLIMIAANDLFARQDERIDFKEKHHINRIIQEAMLKSKEYTLNQHFEFFLHIWIKSLIDAVDTSVVIADMDKMNFISDYRRRFNEVLDDYYHGASLNFDDYSIKKYSSLSLDVKCAQRTLTDLLKKYETSMSLNSLNYIENYIFSLTAM